MLFVMRAIIALICAVVLSRVFTPHFSPLHILGMACALLGVAYLLEYLRRS